jgi:UDP-3-O-[3-hydroxymyristoyl] glucosamine N-acyltransferase
MLRARQPYLAFAHAVALFAPRDARPAGVHRLADVAPDVTIASDASVGAFVSIGAGAIIGSRSVLYPHATIGAGARIGEDCIIHARASIRERVVLGNRVIVQDGAVIGSDGFGFARTPDGDHQKIPQIGGVVIEDDVEIGANTTIDRPAVGETRICAGAKIDNLVQVAHGVRIGRRVLLAAQVGIAGSTILEDDVTLAGQVGVAGHLTLGKGVVATAQSGIPNSVPEGAFISGYPAIPNRDWLKASAIFRRLPELKKAVADLQRRLEELASRVRET